MSIDSSKGLLRESGDYPPSILIISGRCFECSTVTKKTPEAAPPISMYDFGGFWSVNPRRRMKRVKQLFCGVSQIP
jgi:hypothetical protein